MTAWERALKAGLAMDRCLELLKGEGNRPEENLQLQAMANRLRAGCSLEDNHATLTKLFGPACARLLISGEKSGALDKVLGQCCGLIQSRQELQRKLALALAYPALLTSSALVLLPLPMIFSIGLGATFLRIYLPLLVLGLGVLLGAHLLRSIWKQRGEGRRRMERSILRLPVLANLLRSSGISLFFATLGACLEAGIGPGEACRSACQASDLLLLVDQASSLEANLNKGAPFSAVLPSSPLFSRSLLTQISLGEETGTLPEQLQTLAVLEREGTATASTSLAVMIGVAVLGVVVLGIAGTVIWFWMNYFSRISEAIA
jgi:type II secretory pathway component PulF